MIKINEKILFAGLIVLLITLSSVFSNAQGTSGKIGLEGLTRPDPGEELKAKAELSKYCTQIVNATVGCGTKKEKEIHVPIDLPGGKPLILDSCSALESAFSNLGCQASKYSGKCEKDYDHYSSAREELGKVGCQNESCRDAVKRCVGDVYPSSDSVDTLSLLSGATTAINPNGGQNCPDDAYYKQKELEDRTKDAKKDLEAAKDKYREYETQQIESAQKDQKDLQDLNAAISDARDKALQAETDIQDYMKNHTEELGRKRLDLLDKIDALNKQIDATSTLGKAQVMEAQRAVIAKNTLSCYNEAKAKYLQNKAVKKSRQETGPVYSDMAKQMGFALSGPVGDARIKMNKTLGDCLAGMDKLEEVVTAQKQKELTDLKLDKDIDQLNGQIKALKEQLSLLEKVGSMDLASALQKNQNAMQKARQEEVMKTQQLQQLMQTLQQKAQQDQLRKQDLLQSMSYAEAAYNNFVKQGGERASSGNANPSAATSKEHAKKFSEQVEAYGKYESARSTAVTSCCSKKTPIAGLTVNIGNICSTSSNTVRSKRSSKGAL